MKKLPIYSKNNVVAYTTISDQDYSLLRRYKWSLSSSGYAVTTITVDGWSKTISLHSILKPFKRLDDGTKLVCDHIDRNRLNNTRSNLRMVTPQMNARNCSLRSDNKTGFQCVAYRPSRGKWEAYYYAKNGDGKSKKIHIGLFDDICSASCAVIDAKRKAKWFPPARGVRVKKSA